VPDRGYYSAFAVLAGGAGLLTVATVIYAMATGRGGGPGFWIAMGVFLAIAVGLIGFAVRALRRPR
jgi:hypothetical protein